MFTLPRFYPILDTVVCARHAIQPPDAARAILDGGARILQFRHKGFYSREVLALAQSMAALCSKAGALFVINDRADIAALTAAGLHLGQEDLTPEAARRVMGLDAVVGYSTHNEAQLRAAAGQPANYLAIGPIFGTSSKENPDPVVGLQELRRLRPLSNKPVVAIGGITLDNVRGALEAGADSVAVIGGLFATGNLAAGVKAWLAKTAA